MKLPNKVVTYRESLISKFNIVLGFLSSNPLPLTNLYESVKRNFSDFNDFVEVLDCLFYLGKINLNQETSEVYLCS